MGWLPVPHAMNKVAIIAIGRNEGARLRHCLESVVGRGHAVVYVDSNSTDGSVELERSLGAEVVELDPSVPFSAARARNAGFERLLNVVPGVQFVQFVDGDCEVVADWLERAVSELEKRPDVAVVCGRRRERFPEKSVYNRLADLEWDTPIGPAQSCGGDAMMRVDAFRAVGGFDATIVAGEEPELCQRLREKGWTILRINAEMTLHDSAMLHFRQWWRRAVRSGYGAADVATRFGHSGLFVVQVRSARMWAFGWPAAILITGIGVGAIAGAPAGTLAAAIIALALPAQILRIAVGARRRTRSFIDALAYSALTMLGKWANVLGEFRYRRDRIAGRNAQLIDYKAVNPATTT